MALFTRGNLCTLCGLPMEKRREIIVFPYMVSNTADPLFIFSGGGFHKACVYNHPWGKMAIRQKQYVHEVLLQPAARSCNICSQKIDRPPETINTGILPLKKGTRCLGSTGLKYTSAV